MIDLIKYMRKYRKKGILTLKKIYLIGTTLGPLKSINGPAAVIHALAEEFKKKNINYEFLDFVEGQLSKTGFLFNMAKIILKERNAVINVHTNGFIIPFAVMLLSLLSRRNEYYLTVHGVHKLEIEYYNNKSTVNLILEKLLYKNFKNIICVSSILKESIESIYGRKKNVYVINNGTTIIDYPFMEKSFDSGNIKMIMTGGIKPIKGIYELVEAVNYLNEKNINVSLDVYGSYDDEDKLKKFNDMVDSFRLGNKIKYKGIERDKEKLFKYYEEVHLNMCPSRYDTFNVSALESMVVGTPTVITKQAGAAGCIIDNKDGFIIDNEKDLKEQIENIVNCLIRNREEYKIISRNAYEKVRGLTWEKSAEEYLSLFRKGN
jgi:glycosyltransferase involved in cell wall biosynthesis